MPIGGRKKGLLFSSKAGGFRFCPEGLNTFLFSSAGPLSSSAATTLRERPKGESGGKKKAAERDFSVFNKSFFRGQKEFSTLFWPQKCADLFNFHFFWRKIRVNERGRLMP